MKRFYEDPDEAWQRIDSIDDISTREFIVAALAAASAIAVFSAAIYAIIGWIA